MEIKELRARPFIQQHKKLLGFYTQFDNLIKELRKKSLPEEIMLEINEGVAQLNEVPDSEEALLKQLKETQSSILQLLEKELKIVPKNHYRNMWMAVGMAAFGVPLGVAFGFSLGSMAFLGLGLPIGMVIGIAVGTRMDKKAMEDGKQLDLELKY